MKKKILSLMLAMVMMLSLSVTALAANSSTWTDDSVDPSEVYYDQDTVTITKLYLETNEGTTSPAETFTFTIEAASVTDAASGITKDNMAIPTVGSAVYTAGEATVDGEGTGTETITITLPEINEEATTKNGRYTAYTSVGIYAYTIKEEDAGVAGVTYHSEDITLKVTVIEGTNGKLRVAGVHAETDDGDKVDTITNEYSAGSLSITKEVTGNLGDKEEVFTGVVYFYSDKVVESEIKFTNYDGETAEYEGYSSTTRQDWTLEESVNGKTNVYYANYQFSIKDGGTLKIENIPYGVTYEVMEYEYYARNDGYDAPTYYTTTDNSTDSAVIDYVEITDGTKTTVDEVTTVTTGSASGTIDDVSDSITIVNHKDGEIDTGISLDSLPYILMLIVIAAGVVVMISKRRLNNKF